ncbi:hypothetical protein [Streptomyces collinus]|uniref:hypothetical protein n=1 Tax=Streptomyces collinus TaxID=42684 RepID=UPI0036C60908
MFAQSTKPVVQPYRFVGNTVGRGDAIAAGRFIGQSATGEKAAAGTALSLAADEAFTAGCTYLTDGAGVSPPS